MTTTPRARPARAPGVSGARDAPQEAGALLKQREVNELAVFRALCQKNWALKWRGCNACCSGALPLVHTWHARLEACALSQSTPAVVELAMPLLFLLVLCVPRLLIADTSHSTRFYVPTKISELTWSKVRSRVHRKQRKHPHSHSPWLRDQPISAVHA
jgi:hypothetical protein